jgi:hypothetical protein
MVPRKIPPSVNANMIPARAKGLIVCAAVYGQRSQFLWFASLTLSLACLDRRNVKLSARLKEKTKQHTLADNLGKRAKGKERNQDQQQDDRRCNCLMKSAAANVGDGIGERAMVQVTGDQLFQRIQNDKQSEEGERPV